jgi:hypothetical protein
MIKFIFKEIPGVFQMKLLIRRLKVRLVNDYLQDNSYCQVL